MLDQKSESKTYLSGRNCKPWRQIECRDAKRENKLFFKTKEYSENEVVIFSKKIVVVGKMKSPNTSIRQAYV